LYCVVYEFKVKAGKTSEFEKSWAEVTESIYRVCGSLGSRLHKTEDPLIYVAYAQWPSKEVFEKNVPSSAYSAKEIEARATMKDSLETTKRVYSLNVSADSLK
jgi:heme-degrading monooxygenase HmoA